MANENVVMNNGDLTAVGRVTAAKVKVPATTDLEIGDSATLSTELAKKVVKPTTDTSSEVGKYLKKTSTGTEWDSVNSGPTNYLKSIDTTTANTVKIIPVVNGSESGEVSITAAALNAQTTLPTSGTASTTYAINVSGNAAAATTATTAGTATSSTKLLNGYYEIDADGTVKKPQWSAWTVTMQSGFRLGADGAGTATPVVYNGDWVLSNDSTEVYRYDSETSTWVSIGNCNKFSDVEHPDPTTYLWFKGEGTDGVYYYVADGDRTQSSATVGSVVAAFSAVGGQTPTVTSGVANLSSLFSSVNTSTDPAASGLLSNSVLDKGIVKVCNSIVGTPNATLETALGTAAS